MTYLDEQDMDAEDRQGVVFQVLLSVLKPFNMRGQAMVLPSNNDSLSPVLQPRFGEYLVAQGMVSHAMIEKALADQQSNGGRIGEILCRLTDITEHDMVKTLALFLDIPYWSINELSDIDLCLTKSLPERYARRFQIVPVNRLSDNVILAAMKDPLDVVGRDTVSRILGVIVKVAISPADDINKAIERVYYGSHIQEQRIRDLVDVVEDAAEPDAEAVTGTLLEEADLTDEEQANNAPVVRFVNLLLSQAVQSRASDIHVEPQENSMDVRMRIDGMLRDMIPPPRRMRTAVTARIKILSRMNIAERRLPQDGRMKVKAPGREIDVRVSTIPTIYGEKVVMRILDKNAVDHNIDRIGMDPKLLTAFKAAISKPHGIIVVTGPTGSGKSTTLYAALNHLKNATINITTVEDPVEYRLAGINQIQIRSNIGLTFAGCLRSILRQDPDIILVGEIRDKETMEIAIQASLTGHLVLTTFHTNDAPSALSRFAYMGLERYLLASAVNLVTAQRLMRRLCDHCKERVTLDEEMLKGLQVPATVMNQNVFYKEKGCGVCGGTGFSGRFPIFEYLPMNDEIRGLICHEGSETSIRNTARAMGYQGLVDSAFNRFCQGDTTLDEVLRIAYVEQVNQSDKTEGSKSQ